jgi:two-component system invasion response regulator UvrY
MAFMLANKVATRRRHEFQVLRMMASGKTVTEVARELSLSVKTVSTYRARILEKLKLKNSAEAIRYAVDHQLVD